MTEGLGGWLTALCKVFSAGAGFTWYVQPQCEGQDSVSGGQSRGSRRSLGRGMGLGNPHHRLQRSSPFPASRVSNSGASGSPHWLARSLRFLLALGAAVPSSEFPLSPSFPRCDFAPRGLLVTCGGIVSVVTNGRGC